MIVAIHERPIRTGYAARTGRTGVSCQTRRIEQAVAGSRVYGSSQIGIVGRGVEQRVLVIGEINGRQEGVAHAVIES